MNEWLNTYYIGSVLFKVSQIGNGYLSVSANLMDALLEQVAQINL